ncbi:hypothetical protein Taro_013359 [Colocasia esculenta]|uniref:Uncharacterized protein n=1 Tax=Colocasia esculenta TaxID=4460 RepID=A0A843UBE8_COLES|nr:hypothetical protein [Colocasia esculenta]
MGDVAVGGEMRPLVSTLPDLVSTHYPRLAQKEKDLKRPSTFQEVFDKTHKKRGTDQYISDRAQEVVESYSQ